MYRFELICARLDVGSTLRHLLTTESHEARSRTQYFQARFPPDLPREGADDELFAENLGSAGHTYVTTLHSAS